MYKKWQLIVACGTSLIASIASGQTSAGCDSIDINRNGVYPEDVDVIAWFDVLAGAPCPFTTELVCGDPCDIDFNNNGVVPEDQDTIDFFEVLAGGAPEACSRKHPHIPAKFNSYITSIETHPSGGVIASGDSGLFMPALDADGWAKLPPAPTASADPDVRDGRIVYVSWRQDRPPTATERTHISGQLRNGSLNRPFATLTDAVKAITDGSYQGAARFRIAPGSRFFEVIGGASTPGISDSRDFPVGDSPNSPVIFERWTNKPATGTWSTPRFPADADASFDAFERWTIIVPPCYSVGVKLAGGGRDDIWFLGMEVQPYWRFRNLHPLSGSVIEVPSCSEIGNISVEDPLTDLPNPGCTNRYVLQNVISGTANGGYVSPAGVEIPDSQRAYFEDCYFHDLSPAVRTTRSGSVSTNQAEMSYTLHRCILADSFPLSQSLTGCPSTSVQRVEALWSNSAAALISECVFLKNGWRDCAPASGGDVDPFSHGRGNQQSHTMYFSFASDKCLVLDSLIARPSFAAIQLRSQRTSAWNCLALDAPAGISGGHAGATDCQDYLGSTASNNCANCDPRSPGDVTDFNGDWTGCWPRLSGWRGSIDWSSHLGSASIPRALPSSYAGCAQVADGNYGFSVLNARGASISNCIAAGASGLHAGPQGAGGLSIYLNDTVRSPLLTSCSSSTFNDTCLCDSMQAKLNSESLAVRKLVIHDWVGQSGAGAAWTIDWTTDGNCGVTTRQMSLGSGIVFDRVRIRQLSQNATDLAFSSMVNGASGITWNGMPCPSTTMLGATFLNVEIEKRNGNGGVYKHLRAVGQPSVNLAFVNSNVGGSDLIETDDATAWPSTSPTLNQYLLSIGVSSTESTSTAILIERCRTLRRGPAAGMEDWKTSNFTAGKVNSWLRQNFGMDANPVD